MKRILTFLAAGVLCLTVSARPQSSAQLAKAADPQASTAMVEAPDPATPFLVGTGLIAVSLATARVRKKRNR